MSDVARHVCSRKVRHKADYVPSGFAADRPTDATDHRDRAHLAEQLPIDHYRVRTEVPTCPPGAAPARLAVVGKRSAITAFGTCELRVVTVWLHFGKYKAINTTNLEWTSPSDIFERGSFLSNEDSRVTGVVKE